MSIHSMLLIVVVASAVRASQLGDVDATLRQARGEASRSPLPAAASVATVIPIDARAPLTPFPHFWERMFGSERAIVTLRESYRRDLRATKQALGIEYARFCDIFHDEMNVYDEDAQGHPVYNFSYVDQVYDGLLQNGVRPYVMLGFMPRKLSSSPTASHGFWYKPNVSPPKDWEKWDAFIEAYMRHLVEHYGEAEVARWYFEVWNEPNIDFWTGEPKEATYYELYDHTARAIKRAASSARVGGPATAQAAWIDRFIAHAAKDDVPLDFVSTHIYANDPIDGRELSASDVRTSVICGKAKLVRDQVRASAKPGLPIIWSEFGATYWNEPNVIDTAFMGPWIAQVVSQCDGLADMMSYWTFTDIFEQGGVPTSPFYGGFGLIADGGVPKLAFNAFLLLHRLGAERLRVDSDSALATKRADGSIAALAWNIAAPGSAGSARKVILAFKNVPPFARASVTLLDAEHGSPLPAWESMGKPRYLTQAQYVRLREAAAMPAAKERRLDRGALTLELPPHALAYVEIR